MKIILLTTIISFVLSNEVKELRYALRSMNGDTEVTILSTGNVTIKQELQKLGCSRPWDKTCFVEKTYTGKITEKEFSSLIKKAKKLKKQKEEVPMPGTNQYSIGIITKEKKDFFNTTDLNYDKRYKNLQEKLNNLVVKFSKIKQKKEEKR